MPLVIRVTMLKSAVFQLALPLAARYVAMSGLELGLQQVWGLVRGLKQEPGRERR